jgi:hypothetical protein
MPIGMTDKVQTNPVDDVESQSDVVWQPHSQTLRVDIHPNETPCDIENKSNGVHVLHAAIRNTTRSRLGVDWFQQSLLDETFPTFDTP